MLDRPETFSVMEGNIDGYPLIAMIRENLQDYTAKSGTPWFLTFSTKVHGATPMGLPTPQEASDLNRWEDVIDRKITTQCKCVFIGRVTWKGNRELLYYVDKPELVAQEIQKLIDAGGTRPFAFRYEQDEEWKNARTYHR